MLDRSIKFLLTVIAISLVSINIILLKPEFINKAYASNHDAILVTSDQNDIYLISSDGSYFCHFYHNVSHDSYVWERTGC